MHDRPRHPQRSPRPALASRTPARRLEGDPRLPSRRRAKHGPPVPDPLARYANRWCCRSSSATPRSRRSRSAPPPDDDPDTSPTTASGGHWNSRCTTGARSIGPARDVIFRRARAGAPGPVGLTDTARSTSPSPARPSTTSSTTSRWPTAAGSTPPSSSAAELHGTRRSLQNSLSGLGGVPHQHHTDSLSARLRDLTREAAGRPARFEELYAHYGLIAAAHPGRPMRTARFSPTTAISRPPRPGPDPGGSRDFAGLAGTGPRGSARRTAGRRREDAVRAETAALQPLPPRRTTDFIGLRARASREPAAPRPRGISPARRTRLIGHHLRIHVPDDRMEGCARSDRVVTHPRRRHTTSSGRRPRPRPPPRDPCFGASRFAEGRPTVRQPSRARSARRPLAARGHAAASACLCEALHQRTPVGASSASSRSPTTRATGRSFAHLIAEDLAEGRHLDARASVPGSSRAAAVCPPTFPSRSPRSRASTRLLEARA